jgi:hypothetical protein
MQVVGLGKEGHEREWIRSQGLRNGYQTRGTGIDEGTGKMGEKAGLDRRVVGRKQAGPSVKRIIMLTVQKYTLYPENPL